MMAAENDGDRGDDAMAVGNDRERPRVGMPRPRKYDRRRERMTLGDLRPRGNPHDDT